jgi:uncharacterized protein (DUF488 family)
LPGDNALTNTFTIGFTKSSAENFFDRLLKAGVRKVVDVRLNNTSQLSAFAKADDLKYFLQAVGKIDYVHEPLLAPTDEMLNEYRKKKISWQNYEDRFLSLMTTRGIQKHFKPQNFEGACLLCSEDKPHHCHRRLVCEYLNKEWHGELSVRHL